MSHCKLWYMHTYPSKKNPPGPAMYTSEICKQRGEMGGCITQLNNGTRAAKRVWWYILPSHVYTCKHQTTLQTHLDRSWSCIHTIMFSLGIVIKKTVREELMQCVECWRSQVTKLTESNPGASEKPMPIHPSTGPNSKKLMLLPLTPHPTVQLVPSNV